MTLEFIQSKVKPKLKMGAFVKIVMRDIDTDNGYVKETIIIGRFVDYNNMKSTKEARALREANGQMATTRTNNFKSIIPSIVKYNENTQKYYLCVATNPRIKAKHNYHNANGEIITREEYEMNVPQKKKSSHKPSTYLTIALDKVVSIGGYSE